MVVGTGSYKNTQEAFPLDKKTLNQVALRSFFVGSAKNAESGESIGWSWALSPALKKIHENEEDYTLSMSHQLEYVDTGSFFSTIAMGVVLALEQQKADLETIRSIRTTVSSLSKGLSKAIMQGFLLALVGLATGAKATNGSFIAVIIFALIAVLCTIVLRFIGIRIGYAYSTKVVEKLMKHQQQYKRASQVAGAFTIGAFIILTSYYVTPGSTFGISTTLFTTTINIASLVQTTMPGIFGVVTTYIVYQLLTKKNFSLVECVCIILLIALVLAIVGQYMSTVTLA